MKKILCLFFSVILLNSIFADEKLLPPETYIEHSKNEKYFITVDFPEKKITCFENNDMEKSLWQIDGWYYSVFLSNDAKYCVTSDYQDLIPLEFNKKSILFSVYKNGKIYDNVTVQKVINNSKNLQRTESHYKWGTISSVSTEGILLNTVEGKKIYNFETKKISSVKIDNDFYITEDNLSILTVKKCNELLNRVFDYIFTYDDERCIDIILNWEEYGVQISTEIKDGKEVVFLDFFHGADKNWLSSHIGISVCDGGIAFWRIYYDLKNHRFFGLDINGEA